MDVPACVIAGGGNVPGTTYIWDGGCSCICNCGDEPGNPPKPPSPTNPPKPPTSTPGNPPKPPTPTPENPPKPPTPTPKNPPKPSVPTPAKGNPPNQPTPKPATPPTVHQPTSFITLHFTPKLSIVATPTNYTATKTWPPPPPPAAQPLPSPSLTPHDHHHHPTNMLGLHNIFLISPSPSPSQQNQQQPAPPPQPPAPPAQVFNQDYNLTDTNLWTLKRSTTQESPVCQKKDGVLNSVEEDEDGCFKVCRDCGNRAKKECGYSRCRTCCKSRGYDCSTHVKSTWVPAARRKDRKVVVVGDEDGGVHGGGSSGSSSYGGKRQRILNSTSNGTSSSNAASKSLNFEAGTIHQDSRFKESLPGQVRAPAVFRCIQVTAISNGEAEIAYQATVNISGHVFKGFLYDQGVDVKNAFPCISKVLFESSSSGRDRDSSSPNVDPPNTFAASGD
ncbi:hypothetical protein REPUB_Repub03eG0267700 [Reevesia pubescens]